MPRGQTGGAFSSPYVRHRDTQQENPNRHPLFLLAIVRPGPAHRHGGGRSWWSGKHRRQQQWRCRWGRARGFGVGRGGGRTGGGRGVRGGRQDYGAGYDYNHRNDDGAHYNGQRFNPNLGAHPPNYGPGW